NGENHSPAVWLQIRSICVHLCLSVVSTLARSIPAEPEELLRAGRDVRVRTRCAKDVRERAGDCGRGLQIEPGVGPAQHQLIVHQLKIEMNGWRNTRRILDGRVIRIAVTV